MVEQLAGQGVAAIERPEDAPAGMTVVIRSHGVPPQVTAALKHRGNPIVDATCPVSYTHLDVYKRQALPCSSVGLFGFGFGCRPSQLPAGGRNVAAQLPANRRIETQGAPPCRKPLHLSLLHI